MSCEINRNQSGEITGVKNNNELFQDILGNPHIPNAEKALDIFIETEGLKLKTQIYDRAEPIGDRTGWNPSRGNQTLEGAPIIEGATGADPGLVDVAEKYALENNISYNRQSMYVEVDVDRAKRIAQAYDEMEHNPQDPKVKEAYQNLINQTVEQYKALEKAGYKFYFFDETNDPYQGNPWNAMRDLRNNRTMAVYTTESGYGSEETGANIEDNPMLTDTGLMWGFGSLDGEKKRVLANDLFRAVHDAFGHGLEGAGFRARGEENAWQAHARLFTGSALAAITSETRGQNSWLNYGKYGEKNQTAKIEDTVFAEQKIGLMPDWTWKEGFDEGLEKEQEKILNKPEDERTKEEKALLLGVTRGNGTKIADGNGKILLEKRTKVSISELVSENFKKSFLYDWALKNNLSQINIFGGRGDSEGIAFYNRRTKEISININHSLAGIFYSSQNKLDLTIAHEIVHAYIHNKVSEKQYTAFETELTSVISNVSEYINNPKNSVSQTNKKIFEYVKKGSPEEIITYGLTNPEFASLLLTIPSIKDSSLSIWEQLVTFIKETLSRFTNISDSALNDVMSILDKYDSKKGINPQTSSNYANLTEDSEGNFVFFHRGAEGYNTIKRNSGVGTKTSRQEASALSKVGGLAMYYTKPTDSETMVTGTNTYVVKVPRNQVYDFNTDPLNLIEEARKQHEQENPGKAFDTNSQLAYVTRLANDAGFIMTVSEWNGRTRAQSFEELTPTDYQQTDGAKIVKPFEENYISNSDKGWKSIIPAPKEQVLQNVLDKISTYREQVQKKYDNVYHLRDEFQRNQLTQEQQNNIILDSDITQELKDEYMDAVNYQQGDRRSTIAYSIIGQKGAKTLDEIEEAMTRLDNLKVAQEMFNQGKSTKEIRLTTGWELNKADKVWRYEILDGTFNEVEMNYIDNPRFENPLGQFTLQDLYTNDELYKAYPQLKDTNVYVYETNDSIYNQAEMFTVDGEIFINTKFYDGRKENKYQLPNRGGGAIIHEIQHIIQNTEGFGVGASINGVERRIKETIDVIKLPSEDSYIRTEEERTFDEFVLYTIKKIQGENYQEVINNYPSEFLAQHFATDVYVGYSGEVEARNVQNRFYLSPEERLEKTLEETQDIPYEDQFVASFKNTQNRYQIIGRKGAKNLDELEEANFRIDNLNLAQEMLKDGKSMKEIKLLTGWQLYNKEWKYELQDLQVKQENVELNKEYNFLDIVEESDFTKAYPELKNLKITFNQDGRNGFEPLRENINLDTQGSAIRVPENRQQENGIDIGEGIILGGGKTQSLYRLQPMAIRNLQHEAVHVAQQYENFYRGGSPNSIYEQALKISGTKRTDNAEVLFVNIQKTYDSASEDEKKILNYVSNYLNGNSNALYVAYNNLAGEVEARVIEQRTKLSPEEKIDSLLEDTQNNILRISEKDKIYFKDFESELPPPIERLKYKTEDNKIFENYKDALKATQTGDIQAGVNTLEGFKPLFTVSSDTSLSSYNGVINNLIKSGLLSGESYIENGKKVFKTEGNSTEKKAINAEQALMTLTTYRGLKSSKVLRNGDIVIEHKPSSNEFQLTTLSGEKQVISKKELDKMSYSQLKEKYEDPIGIIFEREQREETKIKNTNIEEDFTVEFVPENTLQEKLMTFLKKMGIKTMDMETFIANYKTKNGVHPDASALASIANEVIAFKDGIVSTEDLSEETAHFIVAATPLAEKENLLRNIHKTKEWMEFSETYRKIYNGNEALVREEILGKVLANALQSRFTAENQQTETGKNIVQRLRDIFNNFFNKIASYFQDSFYKELDTYTQQVYNNLMAETLSIDKENLKDSNFNMFSVASIGKRSPVRNIYDDTTRLLDLLQTQENRLHQRNTANKDFIREARDIASTRDAVLMDRAFSLVSLVAEKQVAHLERTVDKGFSHTEHAVYNTFKNFTEELIKSVKERLSNENPAHVVVKKSLESTLSRLATVEGKNSSKTNIDLDIIIERVIRKHGLTEQEAEEYKALFTTKQKDTSWVYANFGSLVQARDPLLGLAGDVINKTQYEARVPFIQKAKQFLNKVGDAKQISKIIDNGFIVNEIDNKALAEYDLKLKTDLFNAVTGRAVTTKEFKKLEREGLELTADQRREFNTKYREKSNEYKEAFFTQEFLNKQEDIFKAIPEIAVEFHKRDRAVRSDIRAEARDEQGVIIFDSNQVSELQDLDKSRFEAMSPVDVNGDLKRGLVETFNTETGEFELSLEDEATASDEAKLAYGLYMINKNTREQFKDKENKEGIPQLFFDKLSYYTANTQSMLDFIFNNAYVGFSDSYWESLGDLESIYSRLVNAGNQELADRIRQQQRIINSIHRKNRKLNRPSEIDYGRMSLGEKQTVKRAQENLEDLFREAKKVLPEQEQDIENVFSERVTNESYKEEIQDLGIDNNADELRFIKDHVTNNNLKAIQKMQDIVKGLDSGSITEVSGTYADYVNSEMSSQEREEALMQFARERLLPYFKRTEPVGFSELLERAKNGGVQEVLDFINSDLVSVKPNFSFYETQVNDNINPKYLENKAAGRLQIKEGFFESKKFRDLFGNVTTDSNGVRRPQKNQELWDLREALLDLQKTTLTNYGEVNRHNIYKVPQIGKRGLRQWEDLVKNRDKKTVVEMIKDFTEFREDEAEFGQAMGVVPKYYLRDLENQDDVTDQYLYSYMLMLQQSFLYKSRVENIGDMLAIETALLNPDAIAGKEAKASNTFKMFRSFMDYNFYGVKETFSYTVDIAGKKFDIAALARRFHRWIQLVNLSGLIVPLTSMLTGSVTKRIESVVGEVINPIAEAEANKRFRKMAAGAAGEMLAINTKSDLNVMMEYIGQYDLSNGRFENSNYNKMTRGVTKWAEFTHSMANFPVNPRVALAVWCDYRYVDGQVVNYNQFKRRGGDKTKWKDYKLFINDTFVKDGVVQFDYKSIATNLGLNYSVEPQETESVVKQTMEKITNATATGIQKIDSQIPSHEKSAAARHGIAAFFLMHSNWLILSATHKFKSRQWNNNTGQYEEGNWMTASRVLKEIAFGFKKGNGVSFFEHVKKTWTEGDETTKRNLNRVLIEMGFANVMLVLSYLLTQALDDDDDDLWAMQFANYMLYRVTNEQISQTVALPRQFTEAIDQPIKGVNRFYDLKDITDVFNGDLVQNSPQYKDLSYRQRWLFRNLPALKDYNRIVRVDREMRSQKLFNKDNEAWTIFAYNIFKEDK